MSYTVRYVAHCVVVVLLVSEGGSDVEHLFANVCGTTVVPSVAYIGGNLGTPVVVGRFNNF